MCPVKSDTLFSETRWVLRTLRRVRTRDTSEPFLIPIRGSELLFDPRIKQATAAVPGKCSENGRLTFAIGTE